MGDTDKPTPSREIVDREVDQLLREVIRIRTFGTPLLVVAVAGFAWLDPTHWRMAILLLVLAAAIVLGTVTSRRAQRGVWRQELRASVVGAAPLQLLALIATGGIDSPLVVLLPPYLVVTSVLVGRGPWLWGMMLGHLGGVGGLTAVQVAGLAPGLDMPAWGDSSSASRLAVGVALVAVLLVSVAAGVAVRERLQIMVAAAIRDREEQLKILVSQSQEFERVAAELAHELKNPLASIHGLSTLLARERLTGRGEERMGVLRGEVKRMMSTLDDFLTYSRPTTPLSRSHLDGRALLERVRALHEGIAVAQEVQIVINADPTPLEGDPRKLQQALVNLVQNALQASTAGDTIELAVRRDEPGVVFEVRDRGPGLPFHLGPKVFDAGVTTRPEGSGLGLTIARTLARQHDGELWLLSRVGGGTVARMELP